MVINHLFLANVTSDVGILSFVDYIGHVWRLLGTRCNSLVNIRRLLQRWDVFLVTVITDVRNIAGNGLRCLWNCWRSIFLITWCQVLLILLVLIVEKGRVVVLLHVSCWWLVNLHIGHLFLCLASLLLSSVFLFLFRLTLLLDTLKLIKDILIVEERVWEFFSEDITTDKSLNSSLNYRHFK